MKKSLVLAAAVVFAVFASSSAFAQKSGGGGKGGSGGGKGGNNNNEKNEPAKPDLMADTITAKWKDAKTLEVTGTVKNLGPTDYDGARTVTLKFTGADGKEVSAKDATIDKTAKGKSYSIVFTTTEDKYFAKEGKWALEISAGDDHPNNDKKAAAPVNAGPQPKAPGKG